MPLPPSARSRRAPPGRSAIGLLLVGLLLALALHLGGCDGAPESEILARKACSPSGACVEGHVCDTASNVCVLKSSLHGSAGTGGASSSSGSSGGGGGADTCNNGKVDNTETDVDCGGPSCPPCELNKHCLMPSDCTSQFCVMEI